MTIRAGSAPPSAALEATTSTSASAAVQPFSVIVVTGTPNGDAVFMSAQALAIIRAGNLARALIIQGLETLRRTVALSAHRMLKIEHGIYQVV